MELKFYRYRVQKIELTLGKKNYQIKTNRMIGMTCINAYLRNNSIGTKVSDRMPMCILTLGLEGELIKEFFDNKEASKVSLNIAEIALDSEMTQVGAGSFINGSYDIIPVKSADNYMIPDGTTEQTVDNSMDQLQPVDMYLYRKDIVNYFNQEISVNLHNVSKGGALQALFRLRKIPGNTVMAAPPQDDGKIEYWTIPMNSLIQNIDELNTYYGLYTCTPLIYWDSIFNELYCINRFDPNIIIPSNTNFDTVQFRLRSVTDPRSIAVGSMDSLSEKMHYVALNSVPTIYNTEEHRHYTDFSTLTTVNYGSGRVAKETLNENSTKNIYVVENSKFTMSQLINDKIVPSFVVSFTCTDMSLKVFKPYKTYRFDADDEYSTLELNNKKFRIGYYGFELHAEGEEEFTAKAEVTLYAVDDQYRKN